MTCRCPRRPCLPCLVAALAELLAENELLLDHVVEHHRMDAATGAGEGARTDGEPVTANPYDDEDVCWACWDAGWHAQDAVERLEVAEGHRGDGAGESADVENT